MVTALNERRVETQQVGACRQADGVAQQSEVQVDTGVKFQLAGILTSQPRLSQQVVVQGVALRALQLSADADVMLRPVSQSRRLLFGRHACFSVCDCRRGELGHLVAPQLVGSKGLQTCRHVLVEPFEQGDGKGVAHVQKARGVVNRVAGIAPPHLVVESVGIVVLGTGVGAVHVVVAPQVEGVDEAGDGHELALHCGINGVLDGLRCQ